jgi:hypothetical protein
VIVLAGYAATVALSLLVMGATRHPTEETWGFILVVAAGWPILPSAIAALVWACL